MCCVHHLADIAQASAARGVFAGALAAARLLFRKYPFHDQRLAVVANVCLDFRCGVAKAKTDLSVGGNGHPGTSWNVTENHKSGVTMFFYPETQRQGKRNFCRAENGRESALFACFFPTFCRQFAHAVRRYSSHRLSPPPQSGKVRPCGNGRSFSCWIPT